MPSIRGAGLTMGLGDSKSTIAFDLMTPKSNQFIGSASNIHDLSLAAIHQSGLRPSANSTRDF